jgi:hypothetical protein
MPTQSAIQKSDETRDQNRASGRSPVCFEGVGWRIRLQQKRGYYFITLAKELIVGNMLKKGNPLYYYLVDFGGRKALVAFLDGKERLPEDSLKLDRVAFLIKK